MKLINTILLAVFILAALGSYAIGSTQDAIFFALLAILVKPAEKYE